MNQTVGMVDRVVRMVLAIGALTGAGVVGFSSAWGIVFLVLAAVLAVTGASGYCPAYSLLGVDTLGHGSGHGSGHGEGGTDAQGDQGTPVHRAA